MPFIIIGLIALVVTIVLLVQKGRQGMLFVNLLIMGIYEGILGVGIVNADGWAAIPIIIAALGLGAVHLLVLFILALALPSRDLEASATPKRPTVEKAMQNLPEQDPARTTAKVYSQPIPKAKAEVAMTEGKVWNNRQQELLRKLDLQSGGELPFDS
jgi:hypothetical protein